MAERKWKSREIVERIVIEGTLVLETPTSLGNGDTEGLTDMPLLTDPLEGRALLTGASIAGALRNYLRERLLNYEVTEESEYKDDKGQRLKVKDANGKEVNKNLPIVTRLFGSLEEDGEQSPLIVDDSLACPPKDNDGNVLMSDGKPIVRPITELRDGVRIDGRTRTAFVDKKGKGAKFDLELLEAGTEFPLRFELLLCEGHDPEKFITALATALHGFENGEIHLGGRKRRGYGECRVNDWAVKRYNLKTKGGLLAWLRDGATKSDEENREPILQAINAAYKGDGFEIKDEDLKANDHRKYFKLTAHFALDGSLLIRSGSELIEGAQPDTVHLHSRRNGNLEAIVSGTSLAGVLRHRAVRIVKTIAADKQVAAKFIEKIFGADMSKTKDPFASRLEVRESVLEPEAINSLIQSRVRIDRFTGGAYESALFDAAPIFGKDKTKKALEISLTLRSPQECEIGLLLLLLKDLWTSDLPIGGESSVGRGRLKGLYATLEYRDGTNKADLWMVKLKGDANEPAQVEVDENQLPANTSCPDAKAFLNCLVTKLNKQIASNSN